VDFGLILISLLILIISGCDKGIVSVNDKHSNLLSPETTKSPVNYVDGRLVFADIEAFEVFMNALFESENISVHELGISDEFKSLYASTIELDKSNFETTDGADFEVIEDPFFASVINQFGEIQINDNVFKYTHNYVYKTSESNIDALSNLTIRNNDYTAFYGKHDIPKGVEVLKIKRSRDNSDSQTSKIMATADCTSKLKSRRLFGFSWITDFRNDYYSAGALSRGQKRYGSNGEIDQLRN